MQPVLKPLAAGNEDPKRPKSRGDILWISKGITVGDVSVIHPAADSYVAAAAKKEGSAPRTGTTIRNAATSSAMPPAMTSCLSHRKRMAVWENQPWTS